jgi:hypothetical protein
MKKPPQLSTEDFSVNFFNCIVAEMATFAQVGDTGLYYLMLVSVKTFFLEGWNPLISKPSGGF